MATAPLFIGVVNDDATTFVNADGTTPKDLFATIAGSAGLKVLDINVTSDDTATVDMQVFAHDGSTAYLLGTVPVVTLSGTNGTAPSVNLLDPAYIAGLDADGQLALPDGWKLQVAPLAPVTAAKTVTVAAFGGEY